MRRKALSASASTLPKWEVLPTSSISSGYRCDMELTWEMQRIRDPIRPAKWKPHELRAWAMERNKQRELEVDLGSNSNIAT